jgi:hypothetical protein
MWGLDSTRLTHCHCSSVYCSFSWGLGLEDLYLNWSVFGGQVSPAGDMDTTGLTVVDRSVFTVGLGCRQVLRASTSDRPVSTQQDLVTPVNAVGGNVTQFGVDRGMVTNGVSEMLA